MNLFELATKSHFRFATPKGLVSVEDLWDLPLESKNGTSLDDVARTLSKQIKDSQEESFVVKRTTANDRLVQSLDIVKRIIEVRLDEQQAKLEATQKKAKSQHILELIAEKENESLKGLSIDELKAMI